HSIVAVARDASNNYATSTAATVTIDNNAPTASISYSPNRAVKSGTALTITATFSEAMVDSPAPKLAISGANTLSASTMTKTDTTHYTYAFTVGTGNGTATVSLSNGTDAVGNAITATPTSGATFTVDNTAPSLSAIASSTSVTTATVTWTTDESSDSKVSYSTVSGTYTTSTSSASSLTSHSLGLTGLSMSTTYYYVVVSADAAGNISTSSEKVLITTASDAVPPTVSLTAPSNGATIHGSSVSLTATASDDTAVAGVKFYIDGTLIGSEDTVSAYTGTLNSTTKTDGTHSIVAVARDSSNNYATSTAASVTIDNTAPVVSGISSNPSANGATISFSTNESGSSQIAYGLTSSYGSLTVETDTASRVTSHSVSLSSLISCATYHYTASSTDASGNSGTDGDNTFTTKGCAGNANIHSQNSHSINHSSGGSASLVGTSATLSISIPASFGSNDAEFQIKELDKTTALDAIGAPSTSVTAAGQVFDLHALTAVDTAQSSFSSALTVTLNYTDSDVASLDTSTLKIYRNDSGTWTELTNCSVNATAKTVTCDTDHFSTFAIFGHSSSGGGSGSGSSNSNGGGGLVMGCTDRNAINYSQYAYGTDVVGCQYAKKAPTKAVYQFARQLKLGMSGDDVTQLQQLLVRQKFLPANTYTVSYFGPKTVAALTKFQEAHASEILTPQGLTKGTGVMRELTRKSINALLSAGS
ncbi:MAG: Ig-like domain-containing protein, partial [Patescibacteria group bacterium]